MRRLLVLAALLIGLPAQAVEIEWVYVGDQGNLPDAAGNCLNAATACGSVPYSYYISKYEVTNAQYAEFLNAVAATDTYSLYSTNMASDASGGITRSGVSGSYTYAVKPGFENKAVAYVSFFDALRFANWLNSGQGAGDTETGAYTLLGGTPEPTNWRTVTRNSGATAFLPSENEWYKAAYYDPALPGYYDYPTGTNNAINCVPPSFDNGNSGSCTYWWGEVTLTDVGAYALSASPYGTFDQGGNAHEWNEQILESGDRSLRGGSFYGGAFGTSARFSGSGTSVLCVSKV